MSRLPLVAQPENYGLLTDFYQLTMGACYCAEGLSDRPASFELFARKLPQGFGYAIAAGLDQGLEYLQALRFDGEQIDALRATGQFDRAPADFWERLGNFRFQGDLWAVPEGTAVFANEPLLRADGPLWQVQLVETYLLNTINYQTLVATRAARLRDAAGDDAALLEFGTRRAFSPQASLWAARAALAAGLDATSNVLAAFHCDRNPSGTMAHSLVMALTAERGSEMAAFSAFYRCFPNAPLLADTYDTLAAVDALADRAAAGEIEIAGIRLDSGDLVSLSQQVRSRLPGVKILASGDLDEFEIARLRAAGACIDGYGLGTKLVTGAPFNGVYKLVEVGGQPVMKAASGKATYPGRKQVFRRRDEAGRLRGDRLGLADEAPEPGEVPLLQRVLCGGELEPGWETDEPLAAIARRTRESARSLPDGLRKFRDPDPAPLEISPALADLTDRVRQQARDRAASPQEPRSAAGR